MGEVTQLHPARNPDTVLENAKGHYQDCLVVGWTLDGMLEARTSLGLADGGQLLWIIEQFKLTLLSGNYNDPD